jgi:hypothetical protein
MNAKGYCLVLTILVMACTLLQAQSSSSHNRDSAFQQAIQFYREKLGDQSNIYNGSLYLRSQEKIHEGHPFFDSEQLQKGSVRCDGLWYHTVPLLFDEVNDELITTDISGLQLIRLVKSKVDAFRIGEHNFLNLSGSIFSESIDATSATGGGYYRVLYEGESMALQKERKFIRQKIIRENEYYRFVQTQVSFYLVINNKLYSADNTRNFFNAFGSHKKIVQDHLRSGGFNFREAKEPAIIEAVKFYDKQVAR